MNLAGDAARVSCSAIARTTDEPLHGTAPQGHSWILLEQAGPWGPDALFESSLPPAFAAELTRRTRPAGTKILLMRRRAGRYDSPATTCYLVHAGRSGPWMEELALGAATDLLEIDLESVDCPTAPGIGRPVREAYLVCTHGRRDQCCAEYGRTLMKELGDEHNVWESSHHGGHRFAANLACFPHALFYGKVDGAAPIDAYRSGRLHLQNLRGRSADPPVVQSADVLLRTALCLTPIDALAVGEVSADSEHATVTMHAKTASYLVKVHLEQGQPRPESCNKPKLTVPEIWRMDSYELI
ncbi:MAG: sucrase ferredoxin [Actinomycetota bacterium]